MQMNISADGRFLIVNGKRAGITICKGPWVAGVPADLIKLRPRGKSHFPESVTQALKVENNSDMREDYFEADSIRLLPGHPLYEAARNA